MPARPDRPGELGGRFFIAEIGTVKLPASLIVDDLMADIAAVFHWQPSELFAMSLTEIIGWRRRALLRSGAESE